MSELIAEIKAAFKALEEKSQRGEAVTPVTPVEIKVLRQKPGNINDVTPVTLVTPRNDVSAEKTELVAEIEASLGDKRPVGEITKFMRQVLQKAGYSAEQLQVMRLDGAWRIIGALPAFDGLDYIDRMFLIRELGKSVGDLRVMSTQEARRLIKVNRG